MLAAFACLYETKVKCTCACLALKSIRNSSRKTKSNQVSAEGGRGSAINAAYCFSPARQAASAAWHSHCYYGLLHWSGDLTLRIRNAARASLRIFNLCGPKIRTHKINSSPDRVEPRLCRVAGRVHWKLSQCQWLPLRLLLG